MHVPCNSGLLIKSMKASMGILTETEKRTEVTQLFLGMIDLVEFLQYDLRFVILEARPVQAISPGVTIVNLDLKTSVMTFPETFKHYKSLYFWNRDQLESERPWSIEPDYFYSQTLESLI